MKASSNAVLKGKSDVTEEGRKMMYFYTAAIIKYHKMEQPKLKFIFSVFQDRSLKSKTTVTETLFPGKL